jgi:sigma-B regulation protein RsbU (phosphoserine phosphatase)
MTETMKNKWRFSLGLVIFALLFFYLGVRVYFVFIHEGSYDGWTTRQKPEDGRWYITDIDPKGPATALQKGDEFLAINGITRAQDPGIGDYNRRVPPGTNYQMTVRRNGQQLVIPLQTTEVTQRRNNFGERAYVFINFIFLLTALVIFLLKADSKQAWLLALGLGTFIGLNTWTMPVELWGRGAELLVGIVKIICLWSLPLLVHFFLIFPERSPLLKRWPKLESWLYVPYLLIMLPSFGAMRLPGFLRAPYFNFPPIRWLDAHSWFNLPLPTVIVYLLAIVVCLGINYRAAKQDARRRLRVILVGSGAGLLTLAAIILAEFTGLRFQFPNVYGLLDIMMLIAPPLIPLSFAYAIIRHKVIPVSLMIRRGVRYLLVSRGAVILEFLTVALVLIVVLRTIMIHFQASHLVVGIVSGVVSIFVWQGTRAIHNRYLAPLIDRHFFRQSYDAQQIMAELADSLRSTTNRAELLELGATKIQAALQTEHVTILLPDEATKDYTSAYSRSYHGTNGMPALRLAHNAELVQRLRASNRPLELDDEMNPLPASLLLPLKGKDELAGIVALGARRGDLPFSNEDKQLLLSVGAPMSFALENTRLIEQMIEDARRREELEAENEQRAKELEEARQLQLSMLPKHVPQFPDLEIAAYMKTATEVGGDYYDFHVADDGTLTIAIGDATGHGLKAGTVVTATKSLFNELANGDDLPDMLKRFSYALKKMNMRSLFMALTVARLKNNGLTITAAGMPPILIYRAHAHHIEEVFLKALPLGSVTNYNYKQEEVALQSGDIVVLMSDGFPERFNPANEMLGYDQAKHMLASSAHLSSQEILTRLVQIGDEWGQSRLADDDVTFVVLKIR